MRNFRYFVVVTITLLLVQVVFALDYAYQKRDDRYEGVVPLKGVEEDEVLELVSVMVVNPTEQVPSPKGAKYSVCFYPGDDDVKDVVVRERGPSDNKSLRNYLLNKVDQNKWKWEKGKSNTYRWSADAVLNGLGIKMAGLGVMIPLKKGVEQEQVVAPAVLYYNAPPKQQVETYEFIFRMGKTASLKYEVYYPQDEAPILSGSLTEKSTTVGKYVRVLVKSSVLSKEGYYEFVLSGDSVDRIPLHTRIEFYHKLNLNTDCQ